MDILHGKSLVLGSGSPRRKELLSGLGVDFTVDTENNFEESIPKGVPHQNVPLLMSQGKSHGFHRELSDNEVLLTADTVVILEDEILGKPHSVKQAKQMLRDLSGKAHHVITAVTLRDSTKEESFLNTTSVHFRELSEEEIDFYVDNFRPLDKAGAYGIQEWIGYAAIESINGSYFNVMGLPVDQVYSKLSSFTAT